MNYKEAMYLFGLDSECSQEELRVIWRKLALKNHPDRFAEYSSKIVEDQTAEMAKINEAYKLLSEIFLKQDKSNFSEDVFSFYDYFSGYDDYFSVYKIKIVNGSRTKKHPDHKRGVYANLWRELKYMKGREGLELRCWEKAIFQLLPDLKRYPDIDGIIHNNIRECSGLLMRLGLFEKAFELVALLAKLGCRSYYEFYPASQIAYKSILKSSKYFYSISAWENAILGKIIFEDIRVHWAMLIAYYSHKKYIKILDNVENGLIIPISNKIINFYRSSEKEIDTQSQIKNIKLIEIESNLSSISNLHYYGKPVWNGIDPDIYGQMEEDIKCILINCLSNLGYLNDGLTKKAENEFPRISEIIRLPFIDKQKIENYKNQIVDRRKYKTDFGLAIIKDPNMDYSEAEVTAIWEKYFSDKLNKEKLVTEKRAKKLE